jgi:hypothetical protein
MQLKALHLDWAPWARRNLEDGVAETKYEGWLPVPVSHKVAQGSHRLGFLVAHALMVNPLNGLVDWPSRQTVCRREQVCPSPHVPGAQALLLIVTIADRDDAKERRGVEHLGIRDSLHQPMFERESHHGGACEFLDCRRQRRLRGDRRSRPCPRN